MSLLPKGTTVTVETKYFPPLVVDLSDTDAPSGIVVRLLRPRITVGVQGQAIASASPAGEPTPNEWPKMKIALAIAAGLVVFSLLRFLK